MTQDQVKKTEILNEKLNKLDAIGENIFNLVCRLEKVETRLHISLQEGSENDTQNYSECFTGRMEYVSDKFINIENKLLSIVNHLEDLI